jgi:hypothetical protein
MFLKYRMGKSRRARGRKNAKSFKRGGGLSNILPNTDFGRWQSYPSAYEWGSGVSAPAPLANGGLYTNPQSTGVWASSPFPATQHAFALEAAKTSGLPEVAFHQRPNDNYGTSYSPVIYNPISPLHSSASGPAGPIFQKAGARKSRRKYRTRK